MAYSPRTKNGRGTGLRWRTTASTAQEETAKALQTCTVGGPSVAELKSRKDAARSTSINFGNDRVDYTSNAMMQNTMGSDLNVEERNIQSKRNKEMKAALTKANFCLGDEKVEYDTTSSMGLRTGATYGVVVERAPPAPTQKSSINFGSSKPNYNSVAHEGMRYQGSNNDFSAMKSDVLELKTQLRKHNFTLGEEPVDYKSDYSRGFPHMGSDAYKQGDRKKEMRKVIEETRKCHFSLGQDKVDYLSNTHRSQRNGEVARQSSDATDVFSQQENAKKMKQQLQRTSIVVGFDPTYY